MKKNGEVKRWRKTVKKSSEEKRWRKTVKKNCEEKRWRKRIKKKNQEKGSRKKMKKKDQEKLWRKMVKKNGEEIIWKTVKKNGKPSPWTSCSCTAASMASAWRTNHSSSSSANFGSWLCFSSETCWSDICIFVLAGLFFFPMKNNRKWGSGRSDGHKRWIRVISVFLF